MSVVLRKVVRDDMAFRLQPVIGRHHGEHFKAKQAVVDDAPPRLFSDPITRSVLLSASKASGLDETRIQDRAPPRQCCERHP